MVLITASCSKPEPANLDYREEMRKFVEEISRYAKDIHPDFYIIPQNGVELVTLNGEPDGTLAAEYVHAIDGIGQEDLFYGYIIGKTKCAQKKLTGKK